MTTINVHQAKVHLSHYLNEVEKGKSFILCKRNRPIAEIRPVAKRVMEKRPVGLAQGVFTVPASFFEELPDDTVASFSGEGP